MHLCYANVWQKKRWRNAATWNVSVDCTAGSRLRWQTQIAALDLTVLPSLTLPLSSSCSVTYLIPRREQLRHRCREMSVYLSAGSRVSTPFGKWLTPCIMSQKWSGSPLRAIFCLYIHRNLVITLILGAKQNEHYNEMHHFVLLKLWIQFINRLLDANSYKNLFDINLLLRFKINMWLYTSTLIFPKQSFSHSIWWRYKLGHA